MASNPSDLATGGNEGAYWMLPNMQFGPVPEPSAGVLVGFGLALLAVHRSALQARSD